MKKFKKAVMGVTALALAFSMSVAAGCASKSPAETSHDWECTPSATDSGKHVKHCKNSNHEGDNDILESHEWGPDGKCVCGAEKPSSGSGEIVKDDEATVISKTLAAYKTQSVVSGAMTMNEDGQYLYKKYSCDAQGVKVGDAEYSSYSSSVTKQTVTGKVNMDDLSIDGSTVTTVTGYDEDGKVIPPDEYNDYGKKYGYAFIRNGEVFATPYFDAAVTDWSKAELGHYGSLNDGGAQENGVDYIGYFGYLDSEKATVQGVFPAVQYIELAKGYEAVSFKDNVLTVDINKTIYNMYLLVKDYVEAIDGNTRVLSLITLKPVKDIVDAYAYGETAKSLLDKMAAEDGTDDADSSNGASQTAPLMEQYSPLETVKPMLAKAGKFLKENVPAFDGETVHAYLLRVMASKKVAEEVMKALGAEDVTDVCPIGQMKLVDFVNTAMDIISSMEQDGSGEPQPATEGGEDEENPSTGEGYTAEEIKEMFLGYLKTAEQSTASELKIINESETDKSTEVIKNAVLTVTVDDKYKILSVDFAAEHVGDTDNIVNDGSEEESDLYKEEEDSTDSVEISFTFSSQKESLIDFTGKQITYYVDEFAAHDYAYLGTVDYDGETDEKYVMVLKSDILGNEITNFSAYTVKVDSDEPIYANDVKRYEYVAENDIITSQYSESDKTLTVTVKGDTAYVTLKLDVTYNSDEGHEHFYVDITELNNSYSENYYIGIGLGGYSVWKEQVAKLKPIEDCFNSEQA